MSHPNRLDSFVREFPFPWSVSADSRETHTSAGSLRHPAQHAELGMMNFETFLEQLRDRTTVDEGRDLHAARQSDRS